MREHLLSPQCITNAAAQSRTDDFRFMTVTKTLNQMMESPRVDCMIMTRATFESLKKYLVKMEIENPTISGIRVYFHEWLGDLIVYGDSENKVIKRIIETCEGNCPLSLKGGGP